MHESSAVNTVDDENDNDDRTSGIIFLLCIHASISLHGDGMTIRDHFSGHFSSLSYTVTHCCLSLVFIF